MIFDIESRVTIEGIGNVTHKHMQEFNDNSNVFGRVYDYHQYMKKTFPNCNFEMVSAKERKG